MPNHKTGFVNIQLFAEPTDANEITIKDLEALLLADGVESSTTDGENEPPATQPDQVQKTEVTETQRVAARIREAVEKAKREERENIAKGLKFESYEAMQKAKELELFKEKGLDPEEVAPVVESILEKRLAEDPRLKKLAELEQKEMEEWGRKELEELKNLTGGIITKMEDIPKTVIERWKTKGSLKAAYLELEGEKLITKMRASVASEQNRSTTAHLNTPTSNPNNINANKRPLTNEEKEIYRVFNPNVTDEQLSKMLKDK